MAKTLEQIKALITEDKCYWCGCQGLKQRKIDHYPHPGGWLVEGLSGPQWLSINCPKCDYDWSLWKLGVKRDV